MPFTKRSGTNIYYEIVGDNTKPYLLMAHGNGNSVKNWQQLGYVTELAPYFTLIMLDIRGHGQSKKLYAVDDYLPRLIAADYIAVLDELNIQQCHFFGNSLGGMIGLVLAKHHPQRFLSFIIAGAPMYGLARGTEVSDAILASLRLGIEQGGEAFVNSYEIDLGYKFPDAMREDYKSNDLQAMEVMWQNSWSDDSAGLEAATVPCLLLVGSEDIAFIDSMKKFSNKNPQYKLEILPGYDHAQCYWDGKASSASIIKFHQQIGTI